MPWKKINSYEVVYIAMFNLKKQAQDDSRLLDLNVGDLYEGLMENDQWIYGHKLESSLEVPKRGIFPKSYVAKRNVSGSINEETMLGDQKYNIEGKSIIIQMINRIIRALEVSEVRIKRAKETIEQLIEFSKIRENLVEKLYSKSDFKDEIAVYYGKMNLLINNSIASYSPTYMCRYTDNKFNDSSFKSPLYELMTLGQKIFEGHLSRRSKIYDENEIESETIGDFLYIDFQFPPKLFFEWMVYVNIFNVSTNEFMSEGKAFFPDNENMSGQLIFENIDTTPSEDHLLIFISYAKKTLSLKQKEVENMSRDQDVKNKKVKYIQSISIIPLTKIFKSMQCTDTYKRNKWAKALLFNPPILIFENEILETSIKKAIYNYKENEDVILRRNRSAPTVKKKVFGSGTYISQNLSRSIDDIERSVLQVDAQFFTGDLNHIINQKFDKVSDRKYIISKPLAYPDKIDANYIRNDIYVTLLDLNISKSVNMGNKSFMVRAYIINPGAETVKNAIYIGVSSKTHQWYESSVFYHNSKPKWDEMFKIHFKNPDEILNSHVRFEIYSISSHDQQEKLFGVSYLSFNNISFKTLIPNGKKELILLRTYKKIFDRTKLNDMRYLGHPMDKKALELKDKTRPDPIYMEDKKKLPKELETLSVNFQCITTNYACNNHIAAILANNPGLLGDKMSNSFSRILNSLIEYNRGHYAVENAEIKKFVNALVESFFNILGLTSTHHATNTDHKDMNEVTLNVLMALTRTYKLIYDDTEIVFEDLGANEALDGVTSLDLFVLDPSTRIRDNCFYDILFFVPTLIEKIKDRSEILTFFILSMPFLARVCKKTIFNMMENSNKKELNMYCEIISSGIRNVISLLYDLSNQNSNKIEVLDSKNSETYRLRDIFISIILLLEILVDQGIQIKEMLVYVNKIMEKLVQLNNSKYLSIFVEIVVGSVIFDDRESRVILLEGIVHLITISRANEKSVEEDESGKNSIVTRHKHVKINFELLASILSRISVDEETLSKTKELALIKTATLDATLDFICYDSHKNSIDSDASSRFAEISMLILFSLADKKTMSDWYSQHEKKSKKKQFTYMVLKSVRNIFKKSSDLITSQVEYFGETVELTTYLLELISEEIFKYFLMPFEIGIFKQFIDTCTRIVSSSMFKRMHQTSQQMQIFRALYPNCHLNISIMVRKMLEKLTASYITNEETISILKEAISFALVEHSSERTKLIKLILKIWNSHIHNTENFELISKIIMDQIFISISGGFGTVNSCHALADIINSCSSSNASFYEDFNINLKKMIPTLLEHRSITNSKGLDSQKLSLYKLYLNLSERNEIEKSISVLKKMYKIEDNSGNSSVEKGFMLYHYLLNLKKLDVKQFSESMLLSFLKDTMNKSEIYKIICQNSIKIFNKNFIPRMTVNMCLSIIPELENESNYSEISDLYSNISEAYKIIKSNFDTFSQAERKFSFFRMEFFGNSIPSILCDQIFVFRGEEKVDVESLITYFSVTFQVSNFVYKSESINDAKKKYLPHSSFILIEKIYPIVNKKHKLYRSELDSFDISRIFCIEKKIGKCKELSQYRTSFTYLLVAKNLPGLCRLVEAFIVFTYEKGPVEHGCDSISLGSQQLKSTQNNALLTKDLGTLIMKLQGIVAAGVNGGIANYESFFTEMFLKSPENLSQKPFLEKLKTLLIEQSTVLASSISTCMSLATTETEFKTAISLNSGFKEYQIQLINCFKVNPNSLKKSLGVMYYENFDPKFIPARFKKVEDDQPSSTLKLRGTLTIGSMKNKSKRASKLKS